jgi:uncharacterized RDD family membrane protein YckC
VIHAQPAEAAPVVKTEVLFAGFWRRVLAYLIDFTVVVGVQAAISAAVVVASNGDLQTIANIAPVCSLIAWAYFALMESSPARGTLGKIALNLFVSDLQGDQITFYRASARYWLKIFSSLTLGGGWVMAAFTPRKQALHDLLSGCLVLRRHTYLALGPERPTEPGEYWDGTRWVASVSRSLKEA